MSPDNKNFDQIITQPYPGFLKLLDSDPEAAKAEFVKYARPWLMQHPSPSMLALTPSEQREIVRTVVDRCLAKEGDPLRNYTDVWGTFGAWITSVAESTCQAKYGDQLPGTANGWATAATAAERKASIPKPPPEERPSRAVRAFFQWVRTPWVFLPILVVVAIAFVMGLKSGEQSGATYVDGSLPVVAELVTSEEAQKPSYDLMPVAMAPASGGDRDKMPETTLFRESRTVVLQLDRIRESDKMIPAKILILNKTGEAVWNAAIDVQLLSEQSLYLRLGPETFPPDDYEIHVVDATNKVISTVAFMIR